MSDGASLRPDWADEPAPAGGADQPVADQFTDPVLSVRDLRVTFKTEEGTVQAVRGIDLDVHRREVLGIVGESGSGKSVTMLAVMGLLPRSARISGTATVAGRQVIGLKPREARTVRGSKIAMIFQDPLTALNPCHRVGAQIGEMVRAHNPGFSKRTAEQRAIELLDLVGIPKAGLRARQYPHEFSGGMRQRAMIAMSIANDPEVLVADEPTTALDVTVQAQILDVLLTVQRETGTAIVFITHDLGVIARIARRVMVMYAGRAVELGHVEDVFAQPLHPYTRGLLNSLPKLDEAGHERLEPIPGSPPSMLSPPPGCAFHPRCPMAREACRDGLPELVEVVPRRASACKFAAELLEPAGSAS